MHKRDGRDGRRSTRQQATEKRVVRVRYEMHQRKGLDVDEEDREQEGQTKFL